MNKNRLPLILLLAIGSGLLAGYLALNYLREHARPLIAAERPRGQIAVAATDLALGSVLREQDVRLIDWPGEALPAGYSSSAADLVGRGLITPIRTNEPILATKLASRDAGGGLPILIPEGMRALSVRVDEVIGVAGFVLPGTRVDVLVTMEIPGGQRQTMTRVVLQNVETLTAGQTIQRDIEGRPQTVTVITLLVTPEQAEKLTLASNEGRIQLALRNIIDIEPVNTSGARAADLLVGERPRAATPTRRVQVAPTRQSESTVVETYRGGERTLSTFQQ